MSEVIAESNHETESCEQCRQPTIRTCEECNLLYCYRCNQQEHWNKCKNYEICLSEKFGFFLKATRDILPGEIILEELPLLLAPQLPFDDGHVACVGCCRPIPSENCSKCPECLWPVCTSECEDLKNMATHGLECQILKLQESQNKNVRFGILLPLRILLLQKANQKEWENIIRRIEEKYQNATNVELTRNDDLNYLYDVLKQHKHSVGEEEISKELIEEILNFAKNTKFNLSEDQKVKLFYSTSSLIQHSCIPNSFQSLHQDSKKSYKIMTRANSRISKNSPITVSYTNLFQTTYHRRSDLACFCDRCQDPTEFGTFFSTLKCLGSRMQPCSGNQLAADPTNKETLWICDKCKIELPNDQMVKFLEHLKLEVDKTLSQNVTVDELEEFLAKLLMFLHQNHSYVCQIKVALLKNYTTGDLAATKIELCLGLIEILRKLYPNGGLLLGQLLHELLQAKLLGLSQDSNEAHKYVGEIEEILKEMKTNIEGIFDSEFGSIIAADEEKFAAWLNAQY